MKRLLLLLSFLLLSSLAWSQPSPACYPGVNPDKAYPKYFPIQRGRVDGVYWLWYCWDGKGWFGHYRVKPNELGPADWEFSAGEWIKNLQNAEDAAAFVTESLKAWHDWNWTCDDMIAQPGSRFGPLCKEGRDYMMSHFPLPIVVPPPPPPPAPIYVVKPNAPYTSRPVYPVLADGTRGTTAIPNVRAAVLTKCDLKVRFATGLKVTDVYATYAPDFAPNRVTICQHEAGVTP